MMEKIKKLMEIITVIKMKIKIFFNHKLMRIIKRRQKIKILIIM